MYRKFLISIALIISISLNAQDTNTIAEFSSSLDSLRISLKIPGMAVLIAKGDSILYEAGLGFSDLANQTKVTPGTCFRIASITKTFTSTLIMQLVEGGKLDLDAPITNFGVDLGDSSITVKNLLTHTSEIEPGKYFRYNGYRYGKLGQVIEKSSGTPFYQLLMEKIVKPLNMAYTAPGLSLHDTLFDFYAYTKNHPDMLPFFENSFTNLSKPYDVNEQHQIIETRYLDEFGAFGGMATNPRDLLKYSLAIDKNRFVSANTQKKIFRPTRSSDGQIMPYGLGWFVQRFRDVDYYWHYGQTRGESGLFVKVPGKNLTLVVLANTDKLSQPFPLSDGDLFMSPVGQLFFKYFINDDPTFERIDYSKSAEMVRMKLLETRNLKYRDFYDRELIVQATVLNFNLDTLRARALYKVYADLNFDKPSPAGKTTIAEIKAVKINQDLSITFSLSASRQVRIKGVGENCSGDFSSWCDYGWIENGEGKIIWEMQKKHAIPAGGAKKNQKVEEIMVLPAGTYKLRYKSDSGHAYNYWDSLPPDHYFWGITISTP